MNFLFFNLILLNCIWDFLCGFAILFNYSKLSKIHPNIWIDYKNKENEAAKHLMAYLILYWGSMRLLGLIFNLKSIILFSYVFEGLIFLFESYYFDMMKKEISLIIALLSFLIAFILSLL
jgi:hypothetical protein